MAKLSIASFAVAGFIVIAPVAAQQPPGAIASTGLAKR